MSKKQLSCMIDEEVLEEVKKRGGNSLSSKINDLLILGLAKEGKEESIRSLIIKLAKAYDKTGLENPIYKRPS